MIDEDDDGVDNYAMYCAECGEMVFDEEDGYDADECPSCGSDEYYEVSA